MKKAIQLKSLPAGMFALLLSIDVVVFLLEKYATDVAGNPVGNEIAFYIDLIKQPATWSVIVLAPLQLLVWTKILEKTDLSLAYPISSLCFPLTMVASQLMFHEKVSLLAWLGGVLIASGIGIVGGEESEEMPNAEEPGEKKVSSADEFSTRGAR